ncbi:Metallo-dependent hydrolase [Massarina eburnea CBS 473.64]|uniref:Metallo-dependent hydrolase n=1 Tax=Massarina eburnea CBS 473.64 TaxID=1395130 RepID=A0A6A6SIA7_9PLEO|nr:Metallo-dependent hydrolase [Massarina eburnea CBS 473.64]
MAAASSAPVDREFTRRLPKIELHAHLTGSISRTCLHEIWKAKKAREPELGLEDPLTAISLEHDINTFFPLFSSYIYKLCNDIPNIEYSTKSVLHDFQADGVVYLELRTTPRAIPEHNITKHDYITAILNILHPHNNDPNNTMKAHLILSIDRRNTPSQADEVIDLALKHQASSTTSGIIGIDLCGDPSKGTIPTFTPAMTRAKTAGLSLTLHFAEIAASATDSELSTLLSWNPDRIGHVIHVNPIFRDRIEKMGIGLELCLSCNVKAKMITGMYSDHHFGVWRHTGLPLAICTDDVGVFQSPLSEEYFLAATHFDLSRREVRDLAERPVPCIFGGEGEKERLRGIFKGFTG